MRMLHMLLLSTQALALLVERMARLVELAKW
jgi:hypothetical protein